MKIKTANIRILKPGGKMELKSVDVKKVFEYAGELFFIHRGVPDSWAVTHYMTGMAACKNIQRLKDVEEKFTAAMEKSDARLANLLPTAIEKALADHGVANELPEAMK